MGKTSVVFFFCKKGVFVGAYWICGVHSGNVNGFLLAQMGVFLVHFGAFFVHFGCFLVSAGGLVGRKRGVFGYRVGGFLVATTHMFLGGMRAYMSILAFL